MYERTHTEVNWHIILVENELSRFLAWPFIDPRYPIPMPTGRRKFIVKSITTINYGSAYYATTNNSMCKIVRAILLRRSGLGVTNLIG